MAVSRTKQQSAQDQHVQRALEQLDSARGIVRHSDSRYSTQNHTQLGRRSALVLVSRTRRENQFRSQAAISRRDKIQTKRADASPVRERCFRGYRSMLTRFLFPIALVTLLLSATAPLAAQSTTNQQISGQVIDASGSAVPNATVQIANMDTNLTRTATTNESGNYVVSNLPIGRYSISVEAQGFKKYVVNDIGLTVDSKLAVNPKLEIGGVNEWVPVQADAIQVDTTTGEVGRLITGQEATQIQLNGRNFPQLLALVPGVSTTYASGFALFGGYGVSNSSQPANVVPTDTFSWNLDGVDNKDNGGGGNNFVNINPDAIAEFKMLPTNYSAEYGY